MITFKSTQGLNKLTTTAPAFPWTPPVALTSFIRDNTLDMLFIKLLKPAN